MRSESSECIPLRPVLRDVASLVQFWGTSENIRLQSVISLFRFVVSFAVFQSCVRGEHGKFISGGTQSIDWGVIACVCGRSSVATGHPKVNVQMCQEFSYVDGVMWDEILLRMAEVSQHLQLLRYGVSSWPSAHAQFLYNTKAAHRQ